MSTDEIHRNKHTTHILCSNSTKCDQLVVRKISKIVATMFQILRLKCIKFDSGYGDGKVKGDKWGDGMHPFFKLTLRP